MWTLVWPFAALTQLLPLAPNSGTVSAPRPQSLNAPLAHAPEEKKEDLRALIDAAGTTDDHDGADAVLVLDSETVRVEDSGLSHYLHRRVYKALTEAGSTQLRTMRFDYDPTSNMVEVKRARVHPKEGTPFDLGADYLTDLPQPQHWIYWGPRMKVLSVPRLNVGDALEVETYTKGFIIAYLGDKGSAASGARSEDESKYIPPMRGHFYDLVLFSDAKMPTIERRYAVTLPRDKPLQFEVYNGEVFSAVAFDDKTTTYRFWKKKLPAHAPEARAADASDYLPKVVMATVPNWEAKSRWFAEVNEPQFAANEAIKKKVEEITKDARNEEEAIDAILHWTAQEIRYSGITMGKGEGYTLHTGEMTFNDRAGVCKDIAGMAITLLRAKGFTSYPAMTMAGARVERVPADQFNHCVVAVKRKEGYRMIDPTWAPFSAELWSSAEREQHYVIGTPEGETLMMTPYLPPEHNRLNIVAKSAIDAEGNLSSQVTFSGTGYPEDRLRRLVAYKSVDELRPTILGMLSRLSPLVEIEDLRFSDHRNLKKKFTIEMKYRIPSYAKVGQRALRTTIPTSRHLFGNVLFADWLVATEPSKRISAIWLRSPQRVTFDETVKLPKGYRMIGAPVDRKMGNKMATLEASLKQNGDNVELKETIRIIQRNVPPADYAPLKKVVDAVRALGDQRFYFERGVK